MNNVSKWITEWVNDPNLQSIMKCQEWIKYKEQEQREIRASAAFVSKSRSSK